MADEPKPGGSDAPPPSGSEAPATPPKPAADAAKAAAPKPAAPAAHAPPKPPPGMAATPWESDLARDLKERFGAAIAEASSYLGQNFFIVKPESVISIIEY